MRWGDLTHSREWLECWHKLKAAYAKATGGKAMDSKTYILQIGPARNQLRRRKHRRVWGKRDFNNASYHCIVGGSILLIGLLALIGFLAKNNQFVVAIAAASLFTSSLMFIRTSVTVGAAHHSSVNTLRAWQRIASYADRPESEKLQEIIFYAPLRMESPTPNRVERTRSATGYCGISSQATAEKRTALRVGVLNIRSIE
jgi:hypothetical protein